MKLYFDIYEVVFRELQQKRLMVWKTIVWLLEFVD